MSAKTSVECEHESVNINRVQKTEIETPMGKAIVTVQDGNIDIHVGHLFMTAWIGSDGYASSVHIHNANTETKFVKDRHNRRFPGSVWLNRKTF